MTVVAEEALASGVSEAYADASVSLADNDWTAAVLARSPLLWWRFNLSGVQGFLSVNFVVPDSSGHGREGAVFVDNAVFTQAEVPVERGTSARALKIAKDLTHSEVQQVGLDYAGAVEPVSFAFTYRNREYVDNTFVSYFARNGRHQLSWNASSGVIGLSGNSTGLDVSELMDDTSHLVVCTFSATTMRLYIDGVQRFSVADVASGVGQKWRIGDEVGYYDDFVVFGTALTAGQVTTLHDAWGEGVHHTVAPIANLERFGANQLSGSGEAEGDADPHTHTPVTVSAPASEASAGSDGAAFDGAAEPVSAEASARSNASADGRPHQTRVPGFPPAPGTPGRNGLIGKDPVSQLSAKEIAACLAKAGFSGEDLRIGVAVALAESGGNALARHENTNGSVDYGLWQINSIHAGILRVGTWTNSYDNAIMAYKVWREAGSSWTPWVTYNSGAYAKYMSAASEAQDAPVNPYVPLSTNLHSDQPILVPEGISQMNHTAAVGRVPRGFDARRFRDGLAVLFRPAEQEVLQLGLHERQGRLKDYSPNWRVADWEGGPGRWGVLAPQRVGQHVYGLVARDGGVTGIRATGVGEVDVRLSGESDMAAAKSNTDMFAADVPVNDAEHRPRLWLMSGLNVWWWLDQVIDDWTPGPPQELVSPDPDATLPILVNPWTSGAFGAPDVWWAQKAKKERVKLRRATFASPADGFTTAGAVFATVGPFKGMDMDRFDDVTVRIVRDSRHRRRLWLVAMQDSLSWGFTSANGGSNWSRGWTALPGIPARDTNLPLPSVAAANTGHLLHTVQSGLSLGDAANVQSTPAIPGTGGGKWTPPFHGSYHLSNRYGDTGPYASYHTGTDFIGDDDTQVHPVGPGVVHMVMTGDASYGNAVGVHHGSGVYTFYAHMQDGSVGVTVGQAVDANNVLGVMGETGNAFGAHTHVELRFDSDTYYGSWPVDHRYDVEPYLVGSDDRPDPPRGVGGSMMSTTTGGVPTGAAAARYNLGAVQPHVAYACAEIAPQFGITTVYGLGERTTPGSDHPLGLALDFMVSDDRGTQLADYVIANAVRLHVSYLIWRQQINSVDGGGWEPMEDRGSITANHFDHVHVSFEAGDFPIPTTAYNSADDFEGPHDGDPEEGDGNSVPQLVTYYPEYWLDIGAGGSYIIPDNPTHLELHLDPVTFPIELPFKYGGVDEDIGEFWDLTEFLGSFPVPQLTPEEWLTCEVHIEGENLGSYSIGLTYSGGTIDALSSIWGIHEGTTGYDEPLTPDIAAFLSLAHSQGWLSENFEGDEVFVPSDIAIRVTPRQGFGEVTRSVGYQDTSVRITALYFTFMAEVSVDIPDPDPTPEWPGGTPPYVSSLPQDVIAVIGNKTGGTGEGEGRPIVFERL